MKHLSYILPLAAILTLGSFVSPSPAYAQENADCQQWQTNDNGDRYAVSCGKPTRHKNEQAKGGR